MAEGRHDFGARRKALRKGRERGCSVYIPAEQLEAAGIDPHGPEPYYKTWPGQRGRFIVVLYKEA